MPRIFVITANEAVFHPPALHEIALRHHAEIVGAAIVRPPRHASLAAAVRQAIALDGWRAVPRLGVHWLAHRRKCLTASPPHFSSMDRLWRWHGVPIFRFANPNRAECITAVKAAETDILLNLQDWYLRQPILAAAKRACINVHTAALPKYRGVQPVVRALLAGENEIGISIHTMSPQIDSGDVLAQKMVAKQRSVFACYAATFALLPDLFDEALDSLERGRVVARVASSEPYWGALTTDETTRFRKLGLRFL